MGQRGSSCRVFKTFPIPGSDLCHDPGVSHDWHSEDENSTAKQTLESEELLFCLILVLSHCSKCPFYKLWQFACITCGFLALT